jgi:hypothetical protein
MISVIHEENQDIFDNQFLDQISQYRSRCHSYREDNVCKTEGSVKGADNTRVFKIKQTCNKVNVQINETEVLNV